MHIPLVALPNKGSDAWAVAVFRLTGDDRHARANATVPIGTSP